MMNKKNIGFIIAGALVTAVVVTSAVQASKVKNDNNKLASQSLEEDELDYLYDDEYGYDDEANYDDEYDNFQELVKTEEELNSLKKEFTDEYGSEDTFKTIYEDDETKEEVNGAQGITRYTDKTTNEVEEYNYFDELDKSFKFSQLSKEEKLQFLKDEFASEYGTEDSFKTVYEDDEAKQEVNGAQGITRYTDKTTNQVDEINNFDDMSNYVNSL